MQGPSNVPISHGSQVVGPEKSLPLAIAIRRGGVLFRLCVWSARSRLWVLLYAALAQLGLLSEPQQICGEDIEEFASMVRRLVTTL